MATRAAKPFKVKVHQTLRYILWFHQDDDEYEAECIDAGATGLGATQQEALQDLITNLDALYQFSNESKLSMLVPACPEDEQLYSRLSARQSVDPSVLGYGVVQLVEVIPANSAKKGRRHPAHFAISRHDSLAA